MENWKLFYLWTLIKITFSFNVLHRKPYCFVDECNKLEWENGTHIGWNGMGLDGMGWGA